MKRLVLVTLLAGCGARSGLALGAPDGAPDAAGVDASEAPDAFEAPDARPAPDAFDPPDAGLPCTGEAAWSVFPSPTSADLGHVTVLAADDAWITGAAGTILHWDGRAWSRVPSPTSANLGAIAFAGPTDAWLLGWDRDVLRWDGAAWRRVPAPTFPDGAVISALAARSPSEVWVGGGQASPQVGVLWRWDGVAYQTTFEPVGIQITQLRISADGDATWLVGDLGRVARSVAGAPFERLPDPPGEVAAGVWAPSATEAFFPALRGHVHHYVDGRYHTDRPGDDTTYYYAAWGSSPTDVWVIGYQGALAHRAGTEWRVVERVTDATIAAIDGTCATNAWAVGERGTILRLGPR